LTNEQNRRLTAGITMSAVLRSATTRLMLQGVTHRIDDQ